MSPPGRQLQLLESGNLSRYSEAAVAVDDGLLRLHATIY